MTKLTPRYRYDESGGKKFIGWSAIFREPGRNPKWVTLRTRDEQAARNRLTALERDHALGLYNPWEDDSPYWGITVSKAMDLFIQARTREQSIGPEMQQNYRGVFNNLLTYLSPKMKLDALNHDMIEAFLFRPVKCGHGDRLLKEGARLTYQKRLYVFFNWCLARRMIRSNPVTKPEGRKNKRIPLFMSQEVCEDLIRYIEVEESRIYLTAHPQTPISKLVRFARGTGQRIGEIVNTRWSHVDLIRGYVHVGNTGGFRTKNGDDRAIPIAGDVLDMLRELHAERSSFKDDYVFKSYRGLKLKRKMLSKRFCSYRRAFGLPEGISFHTLRHSYASWLAEDGTPLERIKELLGHRSLESTLIYAHFCPDGARRFVERTFGNKNQEQPQQKAKKLIQRRNPPGNRNTHATHMLRKVA